MSAEMLSLLVELDKTQVAAEAAVGASKSVEGNENLWKTKNSSPICLFLFSNNVDLKNNNRKCRKTFWMVWVRD